MKNNMKKTGIHILASAVLCLSSISCSESFDTSFFDKEIEDPSIGVGVKIGYSEFSASELFEEIGDDIEVGTTDDNGNPLVSFTYSQQLASGENSDFVSVDNQDFIGDFNLLEGAAFPDGIDSYTIGTNPVADAFFADPQNDNFEDIQSLTKENGNPLDSELTSVYFSDGTLTITLTTDTDAETEVTFTIPSLTIKSGANQGNAFEKDFLLNNHSGGADITTATVNLSDYDLDLSILNPDNNTEFNNVVVQVAASITFTNGDAISKDDKLDYNITFNQPVVETAEGDFKNISFDVDSQNFDLDFFDTLGEGEIAFLNPSLKLIATNGYGFPLGLTLESISGTNKDNLTTNLVIEDASPLDDNIEPIEDPNKNGNYAIVDAATVNGNNQISEIILDAENSNLEDLLNSKPISFSLDVDAIANPNKTNNTNFFDINNTLGVDVEIELPLYVTFDGLTFTPDSFEFDGEDVVEDVEENATSLDLLLFTRNSIPLSGKITLEFLESNGNVAFTKDANLMTAAPVDNNGYSQYTIDANGDLKEGNNIVSPTTTTISFNSDEISDLKSITDIRTVIEFNTTNSSAAKIQSTDKVRLDIALIADIAISNDDDNN